MYTKCVVDSHTLADTHRRMIEEDVRLVDAVCEILDARIPIASRNPDIDAICGNKPRMIVLNRIDMAAPSSSSISGIH